MSGPLGLITARIVAQVWLDHARSATGRPDLSHLALRAAPAEHRAEVLRMLREHPREKCLKPFEYGGL